MNKILNKYKIILTYLLSSGISFVVDILAFSLLLLLLRNKVSADILIASYLARAISSIVNYIINKRYVFKNEKRRNYKAFIEYFLLVIINITVSGLLVSKIYSYIHMNATLIKIFVDLFIFFVNYYLQKLVIFKNK